MRHLTFISGPEPAGTAVSSLYVEDLIPADDVDVGDVIVLPDADKPVRVSRVRLGRGGLIFTVSPACRESPEEERSVRLTAEIRRRRPGGEGPA
jgi:hypothetical protein